MCIVGPWEGAVKGVLIVLAGERECPGLGLLGRWQSRGWNGSSEATKQDSAPQGTGCTLGFRSPSRTGGARLGNLPGPRISVPLAIQREIRRLARWETRTSVGGPRPGTGKLNMKLHLCSFSYPYGNQECPWISAPSLPAVPLLLCPGVRGQLGSDEDQSDPMGLQRASEETVFSPQ